MPYGMQPADPAIEVRSAKQRHDAALTIRRGGPGDAEALARLAALDGQPPLRGDVLLAEVEGALWAALALDGRRAVSDPFRPAAAARALLLLRADHLAAAACGSGARRIPALARRLRLVLRTA